VLTHASCQALFWVTVSLLVRAL